MRVRYVGVILTLLATPITARSADNNFILMPELYGKCIINKANATSVDCGSEVVKLIDIRNSLQLLCTAGGAFSYDSIKSNFYSFKANLQGHLGCTSHAISSPIIQTFRQNYTIVNDRIPQQILSPYIWNVDTNLKKISVCMYFDPNYETACQESSY